jgi:hypothetical protein
MIERFKKKLKLIWEAFIEAQEMRAREMSKRNKHGNYM